jgi:hypothetical protein
MADSLKISRDNLFQILAILQMGEGVVILSSDLVLVGFFPRTFSPIYLLLVFVLSFSVSLLLCITIRLLDRPKLLHFDLIYPALDALDWTRRTDRPLMFLILVVIRVIWDECRDHSLLLPMLWMAGRTESMHARRE